MIHSVKFTCVLDTNVLFPIYVRDLLFWLSYFDMFTPKWSKHIFDEWEALMKKKGINEKEILKSLSEAQGVFPDALVENYESLIQGLDLPDPKDRHVLAAAIKTNANVIVTNNLKDFPEKYLATFGLTAKNADDFITDIIDLNPPQAVEAFRNLAINKTDPDLDEYQILGIFRKHNLIETANYLHALI